MSGIEPSAFGPTFSSRLPPFATTSVSIATSCGALRWSSSRSARLKQKEYDRPRHSSHAPSGGDSGNVVLVDRVVGVGRVEPVVDAALEPGRVHRRVVVLDDPVGAPPVAVVTPVPVAPEQLRLEPLDEVGELGPQVAVDVPLAIGVVGVPPVEERVVEPEDQVVGAPRRRARRSRRGADPGARSSAA